MRKHVKGAERTIRCHSKAIENLINIAFLNPFSMGKIPNVLKMMYVSASNIFLFLVKKVNNLKNSLSLEPFHYYVCRLCKLWLIFGSIIIVFEYLLRLSFVLHTKMRYHISHVVNQDNREWSSIMRMSSLWKKILTLREIYN